MFNHLPHKNKEKKHRIKNILMKSKIYEIIDFYNLK